MLPKPIFLSTLMLISGALAAPPSQFELRLARRREGRQSHPNDHLPVEQFTSLSSDVQYSDNWAGSVLTTNSANFTNVTGTFTVPQATGSEGAGASVWVGIDGDSCGSAILQTGIASSPVTYAAWYEWYPLSASDFSGITITAGDVITVTVTASSTTAGTATIENQTTQQTVNKALTSTTPLCEQNAEWIVEDFVQDASQIPFANFGTVTFTNAEASGPDIYATPVSGTIFEIRQNNQILTSVSTFGDSSVTIGYIGDAQ